MNYFILVDKVQQGPFSVDQLRTKNITPDTLVWCDGMADWARADSVAELRDNLFVATGTTTPPPPPGIDEPLTGSTPNTDTTAQPTPTAPKSRRNLYIGLAIAAVVLIVLAIANPGKEAHRDAIVGKLESTLIEDESADTPPLQRLARMFTGVGKEIVNQTLLQMVNDSLEYHNYLIFSTTSIHSDLLGKDIHTSSGFLGHVSVASLDTQVSTMLLERITGDGNGQEGLDGNSEQTSITTRTIKKGGEVIDSVSRKVTTRIADDVAGEVKKEIKQQTDSTTAKEAEGIVDEIVDFIKNLF